MLMLHHRGQRRIRQPWPSCVSAVVLVLGVLAAVGATAVSASTPAWSAPVATTFNYTGTVQTYSVPGDVTFVVVEAWGAQGGGPVGGRGGHAKATIAVSPGETLNVRVGGSNGFNGGGNSQGCAYYEQIDPVNVC